MYVYKQLENQEILAVVVLLQLCLVLRVHVQVAFHCPQVLVLLARGANDFETDIAQSVQNDNAGAFQPNAMRRIPAGIMFHTVWKLALYMCNKTIFKII